MSPDTRRNIKIARTAMTIVPAASTRRVIRLIAGAIVVGPFVGTIVAIALAVAYGVSGLSMLIFGFAYTLTTLRGDPGIPSPLCPPVLSCRVFGRCRLPSSLLDLWPCKVPLLYWVSTHRRHHQFSNGPTIRTSHMNGVSPLSWWDGLWHSHIGWMFAGEVTNWIVSPDIIRSSLVFATQLRYIGLGRLGSGLARFRRRCRHAELVRRSGRFSLGRASSSASCASWGWGGRIYKPHARPPSVHHTRSQR